MTELCDLSAVRLRRLIGAKEVSPVELLAACRARTERVDPKLNAMPITCWERAEAEARAAEQAVSTGQPLGSLHGLPIGIKDLQLTEGVRTTFGSPLFAEHVPAADERGVAAVRAAGAIVVGKTNTPEFGAGANTDNPVHGATGNAFDPARICGGSSGGSAVALACGMVPLATGSDTGGSLRTPAAYSGVVGFRPSPGLVPVERRAIGWSALSVQGAMGRDVGDTALLFSAMAAYDALDPLSYPTDPAALAGPAEVDLARLRVVVSEDLGFAPVDESIRRTFRDAVARIEGNFAQIERREPPLEDADEIFEVLRAAQFLVAHGENYERNRDQLGPNIVANVEQALTYSFADLAKAQAAQTALYRRFVAFMDDVDLLLAPMAAVPPFAIEQLYPTHINGEELRSYFHWLGLAYGITLTGHPAVSIPCGLDATGTPFGLQLVAGRHRDADLLAMAAAVERLLQTIPALARPIPDLAALSV
jgi:Asp-tRNA(Asn)/Glu-tRNA(Gln) amidotransferase A subunit family amidase